MDYFAYASNLNKQQMLKRCPGAKPKFNAILPNYKLIFTGWSREWKGGTASIKPFRGNKVAGALWEISESDLQRLDRYEDYPATYDRINVLVIDEDGEAARAVTYIKKQQSDETKPSPEYLATIRQGYKDWEIA
jgi:gamma-glutamylcyclotransferase